MWTQRNERFRWNLNGRTCAHCKLPLCLFAIFVDPYNKFRPFILRRSQCVSAASVVACFICAKILLLILHTRVRSHLISSETAACMAHTVMFTHCYLFVRRRTFFFLICRIISPGTFLNHTNHFCESDYTVLFSTTNSLLVLLKFELKILWTFVHLIHELNYAVYLIQIISFMYVTAQHSYNIQMFGHEIQWRSLSIQTRQLTILRK